MDEDAVSRVEISNLKGLLSCPCEIFYYSCGNCGLTLSCLQREVMCQRECFGVSSRFVFTMGRMVVMKLIKVKRRRWSGGGGPNAVGWSVCYRGTIGSTGLVSGCSAVSACFIHDCVQLLASPDRILYCRAIDVNVHTAARSLVDHRNPLTCCRSRYLHS